MYVLSSICRRGELGKPKACSSNGASQLQTLQSNLKRPSIKSRLKGQIKIILQTMQKYYKDLTEKQAESITAPCDKPHVSIMQTWGPTRRAICLATLLRQLNDSLLQMYATITKQDVVMNNWIVRAKNLNLHIAPKLLSSNPIPHPRSMKKSGGSRASKAPAAKPAAKKAKAGKNKNAGKKAKSEA